MNLEIIDIIQEKIKRDNLQFNFFDNGSYSNYYVDTSLTFGVKIFLDEFKPKDEIKDITNKMNSLGISNKIYDVSEKFRFILMEHLNNYEKLSDSKIIENPNKKDKFYLKKVLHHWVKMSEHEISHFDIYAKNVLVNNSNNDVKIIDFDEYKVGNKYILMEYLQDDRFGNFLLHSLLKGESLSDLENDYIRKLLDKREEVFKELVVKDRVLLGTHTIKNKITKILDSTIDSIVAEIIEDVKNYLSKF